ncbi:MAG: DUF3108 domain-containing protein [Devosia sp.]
MAASRLLKLMPALLALMGAGAAHAGTTADASYVVNLGGTIIATAKFHFVDDGSTYGLSLDANVSGVAQLVASGIAQVESTGAVTADGLRSNSFDLLTRASGEDFTVKVQYQKGTVAAFQVNPPIVNNIDRIPLERKQLAGVNDFLASFILKGSKLDRSLCNQRARIFTGIERFDLNFSYARDDKATSQRTGYQGPVVLCKIDYKPISGHFTTSEITNSLAQQDRILIWFAPLHDTGYFVPYRVLLTTSMGDLSMVLTKLD